MPRLLLIEDDEPLRKTLARLLARSGYEVAQAANGLIALEEMSKQPADVVITDMVMREMEGVETIQTLLREYPGVKIIAISGGGLGFGDCYLKVASKLGVHKTLAKPFWPDELLKSVRELLG